MAGAATVGVLKCRELMEAEGINFEDGRADPSRRIGWEELGGLEGPDEPLTEAIAVT
jgi:hypothetical protein